MATTTTNRFRRLDMKRQRSVGQSLALLVVLGLGGTLAPVPAAEEPKTPQMEWGRCPDDVAAEAAPTELRAPPCPSRWTTPIPRASRSTSPSPVWPPTRTRTRRPPTYTPASDLFMHLGMLGASPHCPLAGAPRDTPSVPQGRRGHKPRGTRSRERTATRWQPRQSRRVWPPRHRRRPAASPAAGAGTGCDAGQGHRGPEPGPRERSPPPKPGTAWDRLFRRDFPRHSPSPTPRGTRAAES